MTFFNILIALAASMAITFGSMGHDVLFTVFKPLTTLLLISALVVHRAQLSGQVLLTIGAALLACLAGDILLLDDARFVTGLSAFLVAHLLYLRLFVLLGGWSWNLLPLALLLGVGGFYFAYLMPYLGDLLLPVAVYSAVITIMAWQGIALALQSRVTASYCIAVGAVLFMFSDSIIALNKFVVPFELSVLIILASYWLSITLILNGVLLMSSANVDNNVNKKA